MMDRAEFNLEDMKDYIAQRGIYRCLYNGDMFLIAEDTSKNEQKYIQGLYMVVNESDPALVHTQRARTLSTAVAIMENWEKSKAVVQRRRKK